MKQGERAELKSTWSGPHGLSFSAFPFCRPGSGCTGICHGLGLTPSRWCDGLCLRSEG